MKKQLQKKYGVFTALLSAFVLTFLGLGACVNPLQDPAERSSDGSTGVRISIVAGEARTLLPAAGFSKYVLSFSTDDGVTPPSDVTITGSNTDIISLDPADWTITVTAYVDVEGADVAAAEGSAQVSLGAGDLKGVSIRVSSKLNGADGYFSYNVQYPADISYGYLEVYDSEGNTEFTKDLFQEPNGDKIALNPGYYRLRVYLNTNYGVAIRTEIVHIYPGMETRGDYSFTADDFGNPIEISGTVDLSGIGTVNEAFIYLYRNSDFTYQETYYGEYGPSDSWTWTVRPLPFNQPADLYMELTVQFSSGARLTKRLEVPFSVYDQNVTAPSMGPFTVNQYNLSGVVDFTTLDSLGVTHGYAGVTVYQDGSAPIQFGGASVNADGSWSFGLATEEASLPARIVLNVNTSGGSIYDEIKTTLSASRSGLNFAPGPVSAGTVYAGTGISTGYGYVFVPDVSGDYAFKLSGAGSGSVEFYLYNASGSSLAYGYGYPDATLSYSLNSGSVYYIQFYLYSQYRAFQFQVNPVSQASLGGTVDFDDLLAPFGSVSVTGSSITIYADNSARTLLGTGAINAGDGSWSATVDLDGSSVPAVFVIAATLSNGRTVYHQEAGIINGNDSDLDFSPAAVTGESPVARMTVNQYDYLLYVPSNTGDHSLTVIAGADRYMSVELYDAQTGNYLYSTSGYNGLELIRALNAGNPYLIRMYSSYSRETYQFQAKNLERVTLSGTVSLSGLAPLTAGDINHTEIRVYNGASSPVQLGSTVTAANNGSWSALVPASETQTVRITANIYLKNGGIITAHRQDAISGNTAGLDLAPATVTPADGPVTRTSGYYEDWFLLVPSASGYFNLGVISGSGTPGLYLYDTAGAVLAQSSNGSLYAALSATPYIVYVSNTGSFAAYQFQMSAAPSMTIGGSVDYSGLSSISSVMSSATVSVYLDNPAHTPIATAAPVAEGGSWSAPVPANAAGQPVRLVLTLNLNSGSITSQIPTVLEASALDLDFAPSPAPIATAISGKTDANGYGRFLFVPAVNDFYELQAESDTYIRIYVYDGLTGNYISNSPYAYLTTAITLPLSAGNPYIIQVSPDGYSFHDYQFYADSTPVYGVGLSEAGTYHFPGAVAEYGAQPARIVTVSNAGNQATGALTIGISGANAGSFTVSAAGLSNIAVNGTDSFTVVPNTGLAAGTYTAAITVSGENGISSSFTVSFTVAAQVYSIYVNQTGAYTFPGAVSGYGAQTAKTVTVRNTGNQATGTLAIETSGANADSFTVSAASLSSIAVSGIDTFTVVPNTELTAGTYTAAITISGENGISSSFDVGFTVYASGALLYTVAFDASGGTPIISTAQTGYGDNTVSLPSNPVRSGYTFSGWYTEANGLGAAFTGDTPVTADTTVYAKWLSANANLASLSVDAGWLDQAFSPSNTSYTITVPYTTTSVTVSATEADFGKASVAFPDGDSVSLNPGINTIRVRVTAEDGTATLTYTITVTRTPLSANANLGSLGVSEGTLNPAFSAGVTVYTVLVPNGTSSITVTAAVADTGKAALAPSSPHTVSLDAASTDITLRVTAEDGTTRDYIVTVNKTTETNAVDVAIGIADERIDLTRSTENDLSQVGNTLRLTAPEGYVNYTWFVDMGSGSYTVISDRVIELNSNSYNYGTHSVLLKYEKDGIPYGCEVLFRVVR
jgi:uncharacterized repeat protein (TIGR02543 family)